jgi:energy-converting hydrogenase Eha subunit A
VTVRRTANPAPLVVAASLVAIEGLLLLGYAVLELASTSSDRVAVSLTTTLFFAGYGALLLACARAITRRQSWARSPIVLAQLIQLGLAWSFRGGDTTVVAVAIGVVAVLVLVGLLSPASVDALAERPDDGPDGDRV